MENLNFVDYYEILELSPKANAGTVERVFRHLATRYHPDNAETGSRALFELIIEAHNVLRDPEKRAAYDVRLFDRGDDVEPLFDRGDDVEPCMRRAPPPDQGCFRSRPD